MHFAKEHLNEPLLRFQGDLAVNQLAVVDRKEFDNVVTWKGLAVNRVALDVEPTTVKIAEVVWQEPSMQMVVEADGQLNVSQLAASPPPGDQAAAKVPEGEKSPAKAAEPVPVTIDQVKLVKLAASLKTGPSNEREDQPDGVWRNHQRVIVQATEESRCQSHGQDRSGGATENRRKDQSTERGRLHRLGHYTGRNGPDAGWFVQRQICRLRIVQGQALA